MGSFNPPSFAVQEQPLASHSPGDRGPRPYVATVVMQLTHKHDLGIHTEMIGDGILTLVESGAVTNRRNNYLPGKMVATFALGSAKLYRFMDRNPALEIHPVDFTNDPSLAGLNDNLIAMNATLRPTKRSRNLDPT